MLCTDGITNFVNDPYLRLHVEKLKTLTPDSNRTMTAQLSGGSKPVTLVTSIHMTTHNPKTYDLTHVTTCSINAARANWPRPNYGDDATVAVIQVPLSLNEQPEVKPQYMYHQL